jgi:cytidyltransferase-like protein
MKTVLTFGVFDLLHIGHVLLFKKAKELSEGGQLIVAVQESDFILKYKPDTELVIDTSTRMFMVNSIKYVDKVVTYKDVDKDIQNIDFDIFAKGPDQNHEGFKRAENWCKNHGKEVVIIPRTEGISSSLLRRIKKIE